MTYPIRTIDALDIELDRVEQLPHEVPLELEIELRDGTRWQVDGVKTDVDGEGIGTTFVLCVGPKEGK